jgi:hypothetical protein
MPEIPLPHKSEPFSEDGFERLYERVRKDRAVARSIADEIEADPKRVLEHAFQLSREQQRLLDHASDHELRRQTEVLLTQLRADEPGPLKLVAATPDRAAGGKPPPRWTWSCPCLLPTEPGKGPIE